VYKSTPNYMFVISLGLGYNNIIVDSSSRVSTRLALINIVVAFVLVAKGLTTLEHP